MNEVTTLNANVAECLKEAAHFGFTRVHNVCSGTVADVPWGGIDWLLCVGLTAAAIVIITMFSAMAVMIIRD